MKIGRVFPTFQTDLLYTEHYLAKELKKVGHETVFITSDRYMPMWEKYITRKDSPGCYSFTDYRVYRLRSFFPFQKAIFKSLLKLNKIIKEEKFDILHLYGLGTFTTVQVLILALINGKRFPHIIVSDHSDVRTHKREGIHANLFYLFFAFALNIFISKLKKIITFDIKSIELLSTRFRLNQKAFIAIPLGYDQDVYFVKSELKNDDSKIIFGYAGKIDAKKRVHVLIDVLAHSEIATKSKLIIVGITDDDYCNNLIKKSEESNIEVEFRSFATNEELSEFYNYIDVAVYPGGISITTIEANGCGTPVILYQSIPNLESRVENGRGMLFKTNEELDSALITYYSKYIKGLIDNELIANETRRKYSWRKIKIHYLDTYKTYINYE